MSSNKWKSKIRISTRQSISELLIGRFLRRREPDGDQPGGVGRAGAAATGRSRRRQPRCVQGEGARGVLFTLAASCTGVGELHWVLIKLTLGASVGVGGGVE